MTAVLLTVALLGELEARWSKQRLPLLDRLQPGLEADEMETLMEPLGLSLPGEARVWWGWHDGVPAASCSFARDREFGARGFQFLPLAEAVAEYRAISSWTSVLQRAWSSPARGHRLCRPQHHLGRATGRGGQGRRLLRRDGDVVDRRFRLGCVAL